MKKKEVWEFEKFVKKPFSSFLSFPTCPGRYEPPKKNAILISSDRKTRTQFTKQKCIYSKRNEKQIVGKKHNKKITQNGKSPFCSLSKKAMQQ